MTEEHKIYRVKASGRNENGKSVAIEVGMTTNGA